MDGLPKSNTTDTLKMVFVATLGAMLLVLSAGIAEAAAYEGRSAFPAQDGKPFAEDQIIVKLEDGATQADLDILNRRNDARTEEDLPRSDLNVVELPGDLQVREAVQRYEGSPDVEYAEPDFLLQPTVSPNDTYFSRLYGLNNTGHTGAIVDADIDAKAAWNITSGSPTTLVAVIDEGVDIRHPDLKNNIWVNLDEVPANGIDDDGNGYIDDVHGYDFANNDASVYDAADGDDHGTHVAGTIAAQGNNGIGVAGVDWRASILVCKFMGPNGGYTSDAIEALNYAVVNGAKISNNSWAGGGRSQALQDAIARADAAGHLFVAAAGNNGSNNDTTPSYPASYTNPNIISVAATDDRDALASFSNFGATTVDLAAPGVNILSTLPSNRYGIYSGTSMATPHVAGVAALIKSQHPTLSDEQLKAQILQFAEPKNSLQGKVATSGRLNAYASLAQIVALDSTDPTVTSTKPSPRTLDRTPTITAIVRDDRDELSAHNINLVLDGQKRATISYDANTDRLIYDSERLSVGKHKARITAIDAAGNKTTRTSTFKVEHR
jgi:subtilisin family serine protease